MKKVLEFFKTNEIGATLNAISSLLILVATIYYLCFSISAGVFVTGIFLSFLAAFVISVACFWNIPYVRSYLPILVVFFISLAFTLLAMNSVGDITEFFSGVGMYGNRNNVYPRLGIAIVSVLSLLVEIVANFLGTEKKESN